MKPAHLYVEIIDLGDPTKVAALLRRFAVSGGGFWLPLFGALSFLVSDTLLAYQRFRGPLPAGAMLVALTYVGAQLLIVLGYLR